MSDKSDKSDARVGVRLHAFVRLADATSQDLLHELRELAKTAGAAGTAVDVHLVDVDDETNRPLMDRWEVVAVPSVVRVDRPGPRRVVGRASAADIARSLAIPLAASGGAPAVRPARIDLVVFVDGDEPPPELLATISALQDDAAARDVALLAEFLDAADSQRMMAEHGVDRLPMVIRLDTWPHVRAVPEESPSALARDLGLTWLVP